MKNCFSLSKTVLLLHSSLTLLCTVNPIQDDVSELRGRTGGGPNRPTRQKQSKTYLMVNRNKFCFKFLEMPLLIAQIPNFIRFGQKIKKWQPFENSSKHCKNRFLSHISQIFTIHYRGQEKVELAQNLTQLT